MKDHGMAESVLSEDMDSNFETVNDEFNFKTMREKDYNRILRTAPGTKYLDHYQQVAEVEATSKLQRLERDIPKF